MSFRASNHAPPRSGRPWWGFRALPVLAVLLTVPSCSLIRQDVVVALTEASWMGLVERWAEATRTRVRYVAQPAFRPWAEGRSPPDVLIGPHLWFWRERFRDLRPILRARSEEPLHSLRLIASDPDAEVPWVHLTLVPAVVLLPKAASSPRTIEWRDVLALRPTARGGLVFSPWWTPDLVPTLLAAEPERLEEWRQGRDREFMDQISGLIPLIELRAGRIPAWILPYDRLRQVDRRELENWSWGYLTHQGRLVLYPDGSQIALTRDSSARAEDLVRWILREGEILSYLQRSPASRFANQWSNVADEPLPEADVPAEFLIPVAGPTPEDVRALASGRLSWEVFRGKSRLTD